MTPVFYKEKMCSSNSSHINDLNVDRLTTEIDWGNAKTWVRHEGFYMFGGRTGNN